MKELEIDLMGNLVLTDEQIERRKTALVRQQFSKDDEYRLSRITIGALMGRYTPTAAEEIEINKFEARTLAVQAAGEQAIINRNLLANVIAYEKAEERLAKPVLDPVDYPDVDDGTGTMVTNPVLITDASERAENQAIIDALIPGSAEALLLADRLAANQAII